MVLSIFPNKSTGAKKCRRVKQFIALFLQETKDNINLEFLAERGILIRCRKNYMVDHTA